MLKTNGISINTRIIQVEGNIVSNMGGETVMMSIQKGKYYNLGEVGGTIWENLEEPILINDLITLLILRYDIEYNQCSEQVLSFIEHLFREDLIKIVE
jgi:hypothetical protein